MRFLRFYQSSSTAHIEVPQNLMIRSACCAAAHVWPAAIWFIRLEDERGNPSVVLPNLNSSMRVKGRLLGILMVHVDDLSCPDTSIMCLTMILWLVPRSPAYEDMCGHEWTAHLGSIELTQVKLSKEVKREAKAAAKAAKKEAKKAAKNMEAEMTAARQGVALDRSDHSLILRCNPMDTLLQLSCRRIEK